MPIVTLTSDFGNDDYYVGSLKGAIKKLNSQAELIDISNSIPPFNLPAAAYVFKSSFNSFPEGTVHLIAVDLFSAKDNKILLLEHNGQYFIGPDNGLFSLIFQDQIRQVYVLETPMFFNLQTYTELMSSTIQHLIAKRPPSAFAQEIHNIQTMTSLLPQVNQHIIRGTVIYVDGFENAIVNIPRNLFEQHINGNVYEIMFGRNRISRLSKHYNDVLQGEIACFFNSADYLEIAINQGKASSLLGLKTGDSVLIDIA